MSPIDDELRAALHGRAQALAPSPDPLAGIERRAKRIQRNRVGAAVAGSALAVAMIAVAVPAIQSATTSRPDVAPFASSAPSTAPQAPRYALDPQSPWAYRGIPLEELGGPDVLDAMTSEYASQQGVPESSVTLTPLFGQVYEPAALAELVFVADVDGEHRWGVLRGGEHGPADDLLWDEPLQEQALALAAVLPGDGTPRLLVVADPAVDEIAYGADAREQFRTMAPLADGVGTISLEGDPATDRYLAFVRGEEIHRAPAPDPRAAEQPEEDPLGDEVPAPGNVVDWPTRGSASPELVEEALTAFAREVGATREGVGGHLLYGSQRDGRNVLLLAAWEAGQDARTFAYVEAAGNGSGFLGGPTPPGPAALAVLVPARTVFADRDWLLVVPEPRAGQVLYSPDGGEPQPVADQGTEAAVVIERPSGRTGDRLLVLDGNGDPDRPIYRGTVQELLQSTSG